MSFTVGCSYRKKVIRLYFHHETAGGVSYGTVTFSYQLACNLLMKQNGRGVEEEWKKNVLTESMNLEETGDRTYNHVSTCTCLP